MLGIHFMDWVALVVYLFGITALGVWTMRRVKDTSDFFMGGRRFNKAFMVFFSFGAGTSGNDAVGVSAKTYTNGMSGIWWQWLWLFNTPFYWLIAPVFRRCRALTTGDFFEHRYDGSMAGLYSLVGVFMLTVNMGILLLGAGRTIEAVSGGAIDDKVAVVVMTVLFVVYGIAGGLAAAIITDFIQGILTVVLSFMLLPFALQAVGGMAGLREQIADPDMFSVVAPGEINAFHIFVFGLNALIGIVTQPHIMGVCAAGRNEMDGRVGFAGGNLLKRVCTVPWMLIGLCGVVMYPNLTAQSDIDGIFGHVASDLLPGIAHGLIGLFLAALLASIMSSCDAFMVSSSGLFTQNFYRRYFARDREEHHYVLVGRVASGVIVAMSILFALLYTSVPQALVVFFQLQAMMGAAFWLGLFWRRTTVAGAWVGTLTALAVWFVVTRGSFHAWAGANLPEVMIWDGKFRESWQMVSYLSAAFGVTIVVSLFTPRVSKEKLDRFYNCLNTPIQPNEPHLAPFTVPPGVETPPSRKLINHPDWEIPMPTFVGMAGFASIWTMVGLMIGFVYWLSGVGAA